MKSAIQCIVLLACITICTSQIPGFMRCRCIKTMSAVRHTLIAEVNVFEPQPPCLKREVIAIMKDNRQLCLDPESNFTRRLLRDKAMQVEKN